ncbi:sigma 54-interacting transcriptional regulator [Fusibacter paucivorans]|uniref:Sigma 54-interacting transcriptional regulator n=2 Tax=Fusibacter paucivorans TaxID=76009 RepID=A0ABS5PRP0_9FIRM|nr:sigma 54-interacting transcriptional regulator [Fusibacter paucivorans]
MKQHTLKEAWEMLIEQIEEGVHIVDDQGVTIVYNRAMSEIEGYTAEQAIGHHLLEIFPNWQKENSTLLTVLASGEAIYGRRQQYVNSKGKRITTVNTTLPLFENGVQIGAIEIARNLTAVSHMSEQILALQQQLIKPIQPKDKITHYTFDQMIGKSTVFMKAKQTAQFAAKSDSSVLIYGETGTGKEVFAQSIHYASRRFEKPFIAQNCAAIPETLLEGILFGTTKGAYTGAVDRPGLFEQANGGTLFLDEINHMPLSLQVKLLRVLQEKALRRIGGLKEIAVNVRIITATNEPPSVLLSREKLRRDLYYRINVIYIHIPKLIERREDIPLLANAFVKQFNDSMTKRVQSIERDFMARLINSKWPGNVRELQNVIEVAMNAADENAHQLNTEAAMAYETAWMAEAPDESEHLTERRIDYDDIDNLAAFLQRIESDVISHVLEDCDGNISKAARKLNLSRQNLQYKIRKRR